MSYEIEGRVRYSEIDSERKITIPAIINYIQDCACFHDMEAGFGAKYWQERRQAWVVTAWNIEINRYPEYAEEIRIRTDCYDMRTFIGFRSFRIFNKEGEVLVAADSKWALMDLERVRPVNANKLIGDAYGEGEKLPIEWEAKHIELPDGMEEHESIIVTKMHLDTNYHVNNEQYVDMALKYLPEDFNIRKLWIEYSSQAKEGDTIIPKTFVGTGGPDKREYFASLEDREGKPFCSLKIYDHI